MRKNKKINIGDQFGPFTFLKRYTEDKQTYYFCRCLCGREFRTTISHLRRKERSGKGCTCGSWKEKALKYIGKKFGRLRIVQYAGVKKTKKRSNTFVIAVCDCGNKITVKLTAIVRGHTRSCGCLIRDIVRKNNIKKRKISPGMSEDLKKLVKSKCYSITELAKMYNVTYDTIRYNIGRK